MPKKNIDKISARGFNKFLPDFLISRVEKIVALSGSQALEKIFQKNARINYGEKGFAVKKWNGRVDLRAGNAMVYNFAEAVRNPKLSAAINKYSLEEGKYLADHPLSLLTTANFSQAFVVDCTGSDGQVTLNFSQVAGQSQTYCLVYVENDEQLNILENISAMDTFGLVIEIIMKAGSKVRYTNYSATPAPLSISRYFHLEEAVTLEALDVAVNGSAVSSRNLAFLNGKNSVARLNNLHLADGSRILELYNASIHRAEKTSSRIVGKGVLWDRAKVYLSAVIDQGRQALLSDGQQSNDELLLSPEANLYAVPDLIVSNSQVKTAHSLKVSAFDPNKIFALQSRGLSFEQAQKILIEAHVSFLLQQFGDSQLTGKVIQKINTKYNQ